jgi:ABC-type lipoprotein export system ATPase subunit
VVKTYKNAAGEFQVLKQVDLDIHPGEFVAVVGKSGSGKSTLLNMITGIDHPTAGHVKIQGLDIYTMNESQRALWRGKTLGIVFQFFQLLPMLTLLENVMLPMDYIGLYTFEERPLRAMELLELVGLAKQAHKLPSAVSTGQQQSAAIARALATDPPILIADEPTGNLDTRSADVIINLFSQLVQNGKTIIMVTHDPSLTEKTSRTMIISDGELINEAVGKALPLLDHTQMLGVTKKLEHFIYQPGELVIKPGKHVDYLYLVEEGIVDVLTEKKAGKLTPFAQIGKWEFFGEMELTRGGKSIAGIRAAGDSPLYVAALPSSDFRDLIKESPLTEEAILHTIKHRKSNGHGKTSHQNDQSGKKKSK